jgi:hypothetical protein
MVPGFFCLGCAKNCVYIIKVRSLAHLKERIQEAAERVLRDMLQRAWLEVEYLLDICGDPNGALAGKYSFNFVILIHRMPYHFPNICSREFTIIFSDITYFQFCFPKIDLV